MTPKEKAEELVIKFLKVELPSDEFILLNIAKQCALIAVDEILSVAKKNIMHFYPCDNDWCGCSDYWQQVKNEIERM